MTIWAIWAVMLGCVAREVLGQTKVLGLGFYTFHVVDPAVVLTFAAWVLTRAERRPTGGIIIVPVAIMAALLVMNFVRGMLTDSFLGLLWARATLEIGGLLLLAVTCRLTPDIHRAFRRALVTAATLTAVLAFLRHIFGVQLFMTISEVDARIGINDGNRPLQVAGAFVIGLAVALLVSEIIRGGIGRDWRKAALASVLLAAEVSSGQGTATIATLVMLLIVLVLERGTLRSARIVTAAFGMTLLTVVVYSGLLQFGAADAGNFNFARRTGNFEGRQAVWSALVHVFPTLPLQNQLLGMPGGQMPPLLVYIWRSPTFWRASIHSMYYGALPMMGYLGLASFVAFMIILSAGSLHDAVRRLSPLGTPSYPFAYCIATALLSVTYEIRNEQLIGLFIAVWWLRLDAQVRRVRGLPSPTSIAAPRVRPPGLRPRSVGSGVAVASRAGAPPLRTSARNSRR